MSKTTVTGVIDSATAGAVFFRSEATEGREAGRYWVPLAELGRAIPPERLRRLHGESVRRAMDLRQHVIAEEDVPLGVEAELALSEERLLYPFSRESPAEPPLRERREYTA